MNSVFSVSQPGVALAVTTSTGNVARPLSGAPIADVIRICNTGTSAAFVALGASGVTAAVTDLAVPPAADIFLVVNPTQTHVAAITSTGTAQLSIVTGKTI